MTETTETYSLTVERVIPAPIERVFDAWLDAKQLERFMTPGPGMTVPRASADGRVGGKFHITMRHQGRDIPHDGEYKVVDRPKKLVFTWVSEPAGDSLVTLDFHRVSDGQTRVVLTHERLGSAQSRDGHRGGWTGILEALATSLA